MIYGEITTSPVTVTGEWEWSPLWEAFRAAKVGLLEIDLIGRLLSVSGCLGVSFQDL